MPAPIFSLATTGTDPKATTAQILENEVNRVVGITFDQANPEDRDAAALSAENAAESEANAAANTALSLTYKNQSQVAAIAAGAPLVTTLTDPVPANDTVEILQTSAGGQVWQVVGGAWNIVGWLTKPEFPDFADLDVASGLIAGQYVSAGGHEYVVAEAAEPVVNGYPLTTSAGFKLFVRPSHDGLYDQNAFNLTTGEGLEAALRGFIEIGLDFIKPKVKQTLGGIAAKWETGLKAPVCFYSDSTTDGRVSTTVGGGTPVYNYDFLDSGAVPDDWSRDHDESDVPNAYTSVLQRMAREFFGSTTLRIYNAGWRQQRLDDGWAVDNIQRAVYGNSAYADTEVIAIGFGINDSRYSVASELREDTYNNTKAIIIGAYMRGVQPVLMTNTPITSTSDIDADFGEQQELIAVVDGVKRQLSAEFGLEVIDTGADLWEWAHVNMDISTTDALLADDIHGNDKFHRTQAELIFVKSFVPHLVQMVDRDKSFDPSMPEVRYSGTDNNLTNGTSAYGLGGIRRGTFWTPTTWADLGDGEDTTVYDFWFFVSAPNLTLEYENPRSNDPDYSGVSDTDDLPQLIVTHNNFSASDEQLTTIYDGPEPGQLGGKPSSDRFGRRYRTHNGFLQYGLHRARVVVLDGNPASMGDWFTSGNVYLGWFNLVQDHAASRLYPTALWTTPATSQTRNHWRNALRDTGVLIGQYENPGSAPGSNNFRRSVLMPDTRDGNTRFGLCKVGDYAEIMLRVVNPVEGAGVVLLSGLLGGLPDDGFLQPLVAQGGSHICAYFLDVGGTVELNILAFASNNSKLGATLTTGIDVADLTNKPFIVRFTASALDEITLNFYDANGVEFAGSEIVVTAANQTCEMINGIVGGICFKSDTVWQDANTALHLEVDILKVRETIQ